MNGTERGTMQAEIGDLASTVAKNLVEYTHIVAAIQELQTREQKARIALDESIEQLAIHVKTLRANADQIMRAQTVRSE